MIILLVSHPNCGISWYIILSSIQCFSAPGDFMVDCWTSTAQIAGGVFDGELLLLRLPSQAHNMAVRELGPDGPSYR